MEKQKSRRYEIDSFEKLVNVANKENIDRLSIDLLMWLNYVVDVADKLRKEHPLECEGKTNWEITGATLIWIDDGKNNIDHVRLTKKETGEVIEVKLKKPKA